MTMTHIPINPCALTRIIRDLYAASYEKNPHIDLHLERRDGESALEAFNNEMFNGRLTLNQLVKIGRGEARLVPALTNTDTASWLRYDDSDAANVRRKILDLLVTDWHHDHGPRYWGEIASQLGLVDRDRVVLANLERERLVETTTPQSERYQVTTTGRVALAEGRC